MEREYLRAIEKVHEGKDYCIYSFKQEGSEEVVEVEITGYGRHIIDALGNALLKKSFQEFEK